MPSRSSAADIPPSLWARLAFHAYPKPHGKLRSKDGELETQMRSEIPADLRKRLKLKDQESFQRDITEGLVAWNNEFTIVAIAGTNGRGDMRDNLNCTPVTRNGVESHLGFSRQGDAALHCYREIIPERVKDNPVWFVGHSMGGAAGRQAALDKGANAGGVFCFGSPRSIRIESAYDYESSAGVRPQEFHGWRDIVPHTPFSTTWLLHDYGGYSHVGDVYYLRLGSKRLLTACEYHTVHRRVARDIRWATAAITGGPLAPLKAVSAVKKAHCDRAYVQPLEEASL